MNVSCIICSDLINPSADIYSTQCGHIFHYSCLIQWIERSRSCPQCRFKATEKTIHRIYFNVSNTDHIVDDVVTLQSKLDNANLELKQKELELHKTQDKYTLKKDQNHELKKQIDGLEHKLQTDELAIKSLKEQIVYLKTKSKDNHKLNEMILKLKNQIKDYELIQTAIDGSRERLNELLREESTTESLKLLVVTMKKALVDSENKKNRAEHKLRQAQNQLTSFKREIATLKSENNELQVKFAKNKSVWDLEKAEMRKTITEIQSNEQVTDQNGHIQRLITESPIPLPIKRLKKSELLESPSLKTNISDLDSTKSPTVEQRVEQILKSDSPYLPVQSTAYDYFLKSKEQQNKFITTKKTTMQFSKTNSFNKQISDTDSEISYDGFGGHSKIDHYPEGQKGLLGIKRRIGGSATTTSSSSKFRKLAPRT